MPEEGSLEDLLDNLKYYRKQFQENYFNNGEINPDCSKSIKNRYFFSAKRFYKAMLEKTGDDIYRELYEQAKSAFESLEASSPHHKS